MSDNLRAELNPGTTRGPPRRHAPHGAYTIPAPATRDGVTARHNPTPTVRESVHCGRSKLFDFRDERWTPSTEPASGRCPRATDENSRTTERTGRPMARPVRPRPRTVGASPMLFRALCKKYRVPSGIPNTPHRLAAAHALSANRRTPARWNLAPVAVGPPDPKRTVGETVPSSGDARLPE